MKILAVLTRTRTTEGKKRLSAVEWWRVKAPLQAVAKKTGWQVDFVEGLSDFSMVKDYDLVWFSYMDNILGFKELIDTGVPFVVDFDDDFLNLSQFNPVRREYPPGSIALRSIIHIIQHAPHLSVSTEHLARVYQKIRPVTEQPFVLENRITPEVYVGKRSLFKPNPPIRIGWMGGATHYADIFRTAFWGALTYLHGKYERLEFSAMGLYQDCEWQDLPNFSWVDGSSDHPTFARNLKVWANSIDIFVAPLEDNLFNASKSSIKIQECGIHSKPMVVSNVRPYQEFNADSNGLVHLADTHKEWVEALESLITNRRQREVEGIALGEFVHKKYSIDSVVDKYTDYINYVVNGGEYPRQAAREQLKNGRLHILLGVRRFSTLTGSELYYYELAREYLKLGHMVTVVSNEVGNPLVEKINALGGEVITLDEVTSVTPDLIISSHITSELVRTFTCPIIQVVHSENEYLWDIEKPVRGVDHYVAVRASIADKIISSGIHPDKVTTIWNPIDLSRYRRMTSNKKLLFVGPLDTLRKEVIADLHRVAAKKGLTVQLIGHGQPEQPTWDVEKYVNTCEMTASIYMGRTTLEGWAAGKAGLIYQIDGQGKILSKKIVAPQDTSKFDSTKVAQRILTLC